MGMREKDYLITMSFSFTEITLHINLNSVLVYWDQFLFPFVDILMYLRFKRLDGSSSCR